MTYPYGGYGMGKPLSPYQQQMYQDRVNVYDQHQFQLIRPVHLMRVLICILIITTVVIIAVGVR